MSGRRLIDAGYRVGAIPPWIVLTGDVWSCLQCGWITNPEPSTWRLYLAATDHACDEIREEPLDVVDA